MSGLPDGWVEVRLGDISHVVYGKGLPIKNLMPSGFPVFGANGIIGFNDSYLYESAQLLISCRGANSGTINQSPEKCFVTNNSLIIDFPAEKTQLRKTYYYLLQAANKEGIITGSAQPQVTLNNAVELKLPLPPLNEQHRIVAKLERCESHITVAREAMDDVPKLLQQYRQSVLAAAFRGDLTRDWRAAHPDVEPAEQLLARLRIERRERWEQNELAKYKEKGKEPPKNWQEKYKEPEPLSEEQLADLPEIPEGWCWAAAEEVVGPQADIIYGIIQPGKKLDKGIPYVRGKDIIDGVIQVGQLLNTSPEIAKKYERASLKGGDVLLGIIRATKVAIVPDELEGGNITQGTARFRPSTAICSPYLATALEAPQTQNWLHAHYRGIDMPGLNLRDVRRAPIALPPMEEQKTITTFLGERFQKNWFLWREFASRNLLDLGLLTQSLLAKAFRGELVPQDSSDEPASALLARLKEQRPKNEKPQKSASKKSGRQKATKFRSPEKFKRIK